MSSSHTPHSLSGCVTILCHEQRVNVVLGDIVLVHSCGSLCANVPIPGIAIAEEKSLPVIAMLDRVVPDFHVMYLFQKLGSREDVTLVTRTLKAGATALKITILTDSALQDMLSPAPQLRMPYRSQTRFVMSTTGSKSNNRCSGKSYSASSIR
jgi:hypothetical protein